jgi:hypothetical protein
MGLSARQFVVEHYSLDAVLDRWEALFQSLLVANPAPHRYRVM